ncbi:S8 family serine peptidase [Streptomyces sp. NPDC006207]
MVVRQAQADSPVLTWSLLGRSPSELRVTTDGREVPVDWAWGGADGRGVRVCVLDSGVAGDHPMVGEVQASFMVRVEDEEAVVEECEPEDLSGHGTACAGIIRRLAPECELHSVRVIGKNKRGTGTALLAGLEWAIAQGFDVISMSLSTPQMNYFSDLHRLADEAHFRRSVLVASAPNRRGESFPWRFASVISVGSHRENDPDLVLSNPQPPVDFFAHGQNVLVPWFRGGTVRMTGNSFATPYVAGLCARILSKHPALTVVQLKNILYMTAANVLPAPLEVTSD